MPPTPASLRSSGGLYTARADVHRPATLDELSALFERATRDGSRLTLIGAERSFGEHFLPSSGAEGVALAGLPGQVERLERTEAGDLWVRAPGSMTFERLCAEVPEHIPFHPPTGDRISLGGALAACSHDAVGYLASKVRAFTLLAPNGRVYQCSGDKTGLERELFELVPGSFGALGVILDIELCLRHFRAEQCAEIKVLERGPTKGYVALDRLERHYQEGEYTLGRGLFFFGRRRLTVLLGDRVIVPEPNDPAGPLLLTDDATERNIVAQSLANRMPGIVHRIQPLVFQPGRRFRAGLYGFSFYQRSYDRARDYLLSERLLPRLLRVAGVDPWLGVCHQTWVFPPELRRDFMELYFGIFDEFAELDSRIEQQDVIRLPECHWPLHAAFGLPDGAYFLTVSLSVRRGQRSERRARAFFAKVTAEAHARFGVPVLLLKQAHCDDELLRAMHGRFIERLGAVKREVDPKGVLGSRLLTRLGVT